MVRSDGNVSLTRLPDILENKSLHHEDFGVDGNENVTFEDEELIDDIVASGLSNHQSRAHYDYVVPTVPERTSTRGRRMKPPKILDL